MKRIDEETTLPEYFKLWIKLYKYGAVREVTLRKYRETYHFIEKNIPILKLKRKRENKKEIGKRRSAFLSYSMSAEYI